MTFRAVPSIEAEYTRVTVVGAPTTGQLISLTEVLGVDSRSWPQPMLLRVFTDEDEAIAWLLA